MATNIVDILMRIQGDRNVLESIDRITRELNDLERELEQQNRASRSASAAFDRISTSLRNFGAGIVAGFTIDAVIGFTTEMLNSARVIENYAERSGFAAERIQLMSQAAERAGIDAGDMSDFLVDLNFEIGDAIKNGGAVAEKFNTWGIALRTATGEARSNEEVLREVIDRLQQLSTAQERATFIANLFGEDNQKLIPILLQGNDALDELRKGLEATGAIMSSETINKNVEAAKAISETTASVKALAQSLIANLSPIIQTTAKEMTKFIEITRREIESLSGLVETVKEGLRWWGFMDEAVEENTKTVEENKIVLNEMPEVYGRLSDGSVIYTNSLVEITSNTKEAIEAHKDFERQLKEQERAAKRAADINAELANSIKQIGLEGIELEKTKLDREIDRLSKRLAETGDIEGIEKGEKLLGELQKKRLEEIEQKFSDVEDKKVELTESSSEKQKDIVTDAAKHAETQWKNAAKEGIGAFEQELQSEGVRQGITELAGFASKSFAKAFADSMRTELSHQQFFGAAAAGTFVESGTLAIAEMANEAKALEETLNKIREGAIKSSEAEIRGIAARLEEIAAFSDPFKGGIGGVKTFSEAAIQDIIAGAGRGETRGTGQAGRAAININVTANDAMSFENQETIQQLEDIAVNLSDKIGL